MDDVDPVSRRRKRFRYRRFLPAAVLFVAAWIAVSAPPAHAHGVGGVASRNYESRLVRVEPEVGGVDLSVVDLGDAVRLTNRSRRDTVVVGYDGEPYLRVGPRGTFENTRSPATYLNRTLVPTEQAPPRADPGADPSWRKVSDASTVTWHDHRVHYTGSTDPAVVRQDRSSRHVVGRWVIELRVGERTARATGQLVWVPPPSPWPWVGVAAAVAAAALIATRSRAWRLVLTLALAALVAVEVVHVVGTWDATVASTGSKLGASAYSVAGITLGLLGLAWAWRRGLDAAMPLVLIAAVVLFVAGGLADVSTLGRSQLPTTLPPAVARLLVALTLGLGAAVGGAAAVRLRRPEPPRPAARPATRTASPVAR